MRSNPIPLRSAAVGLVAAALVAFAANSILTRMALGAGSIDPYSFTAVRLGSGAIVLLALNLPAIASGSGVQGSWAGTALLALYAAPFSLSYVRLDTGTGALLLFGSVQLTMIGYGLLSGSRPRPLEWMGLIGAGAGVAYLVSPGLTAPDLPGALFMIAAGIGWGGYSIVGRGVTRPSLATAGNFARASAVVVPLTIFGWSGLEWSVRGIALAATSGAVASGLGYAIWYNALGRISLTHAALVQLAVPALAALGGVVFIGETLTTRLLLASAVILGSVAVGILGRRDSPRR